MAEMDLTDFVHWTAVLEYEDRQSLSVPTIPPQGAQRRRSGPKVSNPADMAAVLTGLAEKRLRA